MVIHVEAGRHAAGKQFQYAQPRKGVDRLRIELRLARKDLLEEPVLQGQPVREGAQEHHGYVRVRILEAGYDQVPVQVYFPLESGPFRRLRAYIAYPFALGPELALRDGAIILPEHGHYSGVI